MPRVFGLACLGFLSAACLFGGSNLPAQEGKSRGLIPKDWNDTVEKAVAYLKSKQAEDGTWSKQSSLGVTAVVARALLRSGKVTPSDPAIQKAIQFIVSLAHPDGHLAGAGPKVRQANYVTSVGLLALAETDPKGYATLIGKAANFLKGQVYDEARKKDSKDVYYGGFGYDATTRPDLSNTVFCLEALHAGKVPQSDPVYRKALIYVSRSQNLKSEFSDQPWAGAINDGSFVYGAGPASAPKNKSAAPDAPRPGYGSITCSGFVSLDDCGVKKDDLRSRKALEWIQKNYSLDMNPGKNGEQGMYLYLHMMASALERAGLDTVVDGKKQTHDWRADIAAALRSRQRPDGSWANKVGAWMETNPDLATSWALMALSYCKPQGK